jgi:nitrogen fixation/metabolism regulation signal transduction histidine kinase
VEEKMSIEAMKQALEVLEQINQLSIGENAIALPGEIDAAMDNLRAAIEQAEKRQWVELTDDEARALVNRVTFGDRTNWQALVYIVDAKLKEKNT